MIDPDPQRRGRRDWGAWVGGGIWGRGQERTIDSYSMECEKLVAVGRGLMYADGSVTA